MAEPQLQQAYSEKLFVNHEKEIKCVRQAMQDALDHKPGRTRVLTFKGERGSGKTWLIRYLGDTLPGPLIQAHNGAGTPTKSVNVLSLFLAPPQVELESYNRTQRSDCLFYGLHPLLSNLPDSELISRIVRWVCTKWNVNHNANASLSDLIFWLGRDLPQETGAVFVLLVDSVFEFGRIGTDRLPMLEDQLLAPLASLANGLVVMTGRGASFPWRSVAVRQSHLESTLSPFDSANDISEQLRRSAMNDDQQRAKYIHELGGGYPLNTYVLGQFDPPEKGLDTLCNILLDVVPENNRRSVREALEALCVLDRFREREIAALVAQWRSLSTDKELTMEEARSIRDLLLDNYLMQWVNDGFVINESVRIAYRSYMKHRRRSNNEGTTEYNDMIDHAIRLYYDWSKKYPNSRQHYLRLAQQLEAQRMPERALLPAS